MQNGEQILEIGSRAPADWRKNKRLVQEGFKDLAYLPRSRAGWHGTLAAMAYSALRQRRGGPWLDLWAMMHAVPASARYAELGDDALVLWHGTSAQRAARIREVGLFHKRGLWTTLEPRIAHGYSRRRSESHAEGSATVVLLLDRREVKPDVDYEAQGEILRFFHGLPPDAVEYILWDDRIVFHGGQKAASPRPWITSRFKRVEGRWVPMSQPPVRFDANLSYGTLDEWLELSLERILKLLETACAVEIFSSLYATIDPWDALEHKTVFGALDRLCHVSSPRGDRRLSLLREDAETAVPRPRGRRRATR